MELSRKHLEATLISYLRIDPDRADTFLSRIKTLQRMGFPPGTNVGRGPKMIYAAEHLLQLITVFELQQMGLPADRAIKTTLEGWARIRAGYGAAYDLRMKPRLDVQPTIVGVIISRSLAELQVKKRGPGKQAIVKIMDISTLAERLLRSGVSDMVKSAIILDISGVIYDLSMSFHRIGISNRRDPEILSWAPTDMSVLFFTGPEAPNASNP